MRRTVLLLVGVLLAVVVLGSDSPKQYDNKTEYLGIEGRWQSTESMLGGWKLDSPSQCVMTNSSGTYMFSGDDTGRGNYRIDPTRHPPHLDRFPSSGPFHGHTLKFIYQIDGDSLKIAHIPGAVKDHRPQGFKDEGVYVETYKRVK